MGLFSERWQSTLSVRDKASLSAVCTTISALSCYLYKYEGATFGNTDLIGRFIKGTFEKNPGLPKQSLEETWDANTVLSMFET